MLKRLSLLLLLISISALPIAVQAQSYYLALPQEVVNVYFNADGSQTIDYLLVFRNEPTGHAIEFVDLGFPYNARVDTNAIEADVDGQPLTYFSESEYEGSGSGVAIGLGAYSIPPGGNSRVHIYMGKVERILYDDTEDSKYVSSNFSPFTIGAGYLSSYTDLTVTFHFPPGVQPEEPRWHSAPNGFPNEPETGIDDEGNIYYTWRNQNADMSETYLFGASFPKTYIPERAIVRPNIFEWLAGAISTAIEWFLPLSCIGGFIGLFAFGVWSGNRRKLQYLPPKISIEGHGIKRGLTAVEAAVLLEQPLDKIFTMILFGLIKKEATQVKKRDPLEIAVPDPLPDGLHPYESDFLKAFAQKGAQRRRELQDTTVALVRAVSQKMKGFSRRETVDYYKDIMRRAWQQVEQAQTPEVKSQKFDEVMEWTMLDGDYDGRTRRVFTGPVFVPTWWGRYDPGYPRAGAAIPSGKVSAPSVGAPPSLPQLPGADFAASIVGGAQNFANSVMGSVTDFTSRVTNQTNPPPVSTSSSSTRSGGGGGSGGRSCACACACACAGCACACAGGGR